MTRYSQFQYTVHIIFQPFHFQTASLQNLNKEAGPTLHKGEHCSQFLKLCFITVFAHTRLWKTKHPPKRFQKFRQSCVLLTDRMEIHQLQPLVRPSDLLYVMLSGCDWWISIWSVNKPRKTAGNFGNVSAGVLFRVSTKTVVTTAFMTFSTNSPNNPLGLACFLFSNRPDWLITTNQTEEGKVGHEHLAAL